MIQNVVKSLRSGSLVITVHEAACLVEHEDKLLIGLKGTRLYVLKRDFSTRSKWKWYSLFSNNYWSSMDELGLEAYINEMDTVYCISDAIDLAELLNSRLK